MLNDGARRELLFIRVLVCSALLTAAGAQALLNLIGWLGGSRLGWPLESCGYAALVTVPLVLMYRRYRKVYTGGRWEARTDPLTGLANRRQLMEDLAHLTAADADPRVFALFDLDGFKSYNDSFGHPAGDALLAELAEGLRMAVAPDGAASRLGGDEFCIVAPRTPNGHEPITAASAALSAHGEGFTIASSCGVVFLPQEAHDAGAALRLTDRRMYAVKTAALARPSARCETCYSARYASGSRPLTGT